jgi:hypothetical protein
MVLRYMLVVLCDMFLVTSVMTVEYVLHGLYRPELNPLDLYLWGHLKPPCTLLLLTTKRHLTIALWTRVRLSATNPAFLNGWTVRDETYQSVH